MLALAPFSKKPLQLNITGITNDNIDTTVDAIRVVLLKQLLKFGIEESTLKITKRGAPPLGGTSYNLKLKAVKFIFLVESLSN